MCKKSLRKYVRAFKCLLLILAGCCCDHSCQAQDLIKTMLEQIAKLEVTLQEAKQGYAIVQKGLNVIGDIKNGRFNLHSAYFASLLSVNPSVKTYGGVADIVTMQMAILKTCKSTVGPLTATGLYSAQQLTYLSRVLAGLADLTAKDMDELIAILTNGNWQMTDDQRLARIDVLYHQVMDKYAFLQRFCDQTRNAGVQRSLEIKSYQKLANLF